MYSVVLNGVNFHYLHGFMQDKSQHVHYIVAAWLHRQVSDEDRGKTPSMELQVAIAAAAPCIYHVLFAYTPTGFRV